MPVETCSLDYVCAVAVTPGGGASAGDSHCG